MVGSTVEIPLKTNSDGTGAIYVNPSAPMAGNGVEEVTTGLTAVGVHSFWAFSPSETTS